jgi:hypothetical protein
MSVVSISVSIICAAAAMVDIPQELAALSSLCPLPRTKTRMLAHWWHSKARASAHSQMVPDSLAMTTTSNLRCATMKILSLPSTYRAHCTHFDITIAGGTFCPDTEVPCQLSSLSSLLLSRPASSLPNLMADCCIVVIITS